MQSKKTAKNAIIFKNLNSINSSKINLALVK